MTRCYEFSFEVRGFDPENDAAVERLYDAFEDVSVSRQGGRTLIEFVVEASGEWAALSSTRKSLEEEFPQVRVLRLDRDLVAIPDIAQRLDRTPESVRLLVNGQRGRGGFPAEVGILGGGTRIWEWASVVAWAKPQGMCADENDPISPDCAAYFDATVANDPCSHFVPPLPATRSQATRRQAGTGSRVFFGTPNSWYSTKVTESPRSPHGKQASSGATR